MINNRYYNGNYKSIICMFICTLDVKNKPNLGLKYLIKKRIDTFSASHDQAFDLVDVLIERRRNMQETVFLIIISMSFI